MFRQPFPNSSSTNKNFMNIERAANKSAFSNPSVQDPIQNRSMGFKKFGNLTTQNKFNNRTQDNQTRFSKPGGAFNNPSYFQNGLSMEEEKQLQLNNQNNQFFERNIQQAKNSSNRDFKPRFEDKQDQQNNNYRGSGKGPHNNRFQNTGFDNKRQHYHPNSSNTMDVEENQFPMEERNYSGHSGVYQGKTQKPSFSQNSNNRLSNTKPISYQPRSTQQRPQMAFQQKKKNFEINNQNPEFEEEEDENAYEEEENVNYRPPQKFKYKQSESRGETEEQNPPKLDMKKWGGRIVKKNERDPQNEDPQENFSRERSRGQSWKNSKRNRAENEEEEEEDEEQFDQEEFSNEKHSNFESLKSRLMRKRNTQNAQITEEKQQFKRPSLLDKPERAQKPHERMIRRLITQPKKQPTERTFEKPTTTSKSMMSNQETHEENSVMKKPANSNNFRGEFNNNLDEGNNENPIDLKAKLKKKFLKSKEEVENDVLNLNSRWRMCTEAEGKLREAGRQLDIFERDPEYFINGQWMDNLPRAKPEWCVKKYSRSDAGKEYEQPFPLNVLESTLNYIIDHIIDVDNQRNVPYMTKLGDDTHSFFDIYDFIYDRFRGINKDLTVLKMDTKKETIDMIEKMLRFFILAINEGSENPEFGMFRNIERITDFLTTLITSYKKSRECLKNCLMSENKNIKEKDFYISPNEAEFFAYIIIFTQEKPLEMEKNLGILGDKDFDEIRYAPEITFALKAISSIKEQNTVEYFRCMKKANYLQACSIYYFINKIRIGCLDHFVRMSLKNKNDDGIINPISLSYLQNLLYFNNCNDLVIYLDAYGLDTSYLALEDAFEDETHLQASFLRDWKTYEEEKNYEKLSNFWQKNRKIDEKKMIKNFPSFTNSKNQANYFNNKDVSRKFILNGEWKNNDSVAYEKKLIDKFCEGNNKCEPKIFVAKPQIEQKPKSFVPLIAPQPVKNEKVFEKIPSEPKIIKTSILTTPTINVIPNYPNPILEQKMPVSPFSKPYEKQNSNTLLSQTKPIKAIIKNEIEMEKKVKFLKEIIKRKEIKAKSLCFDIWLENIQAEKEYEKDEIGKIFEYDFRSELHSNKSKTDISESFNFINSFKSENYSNDFVSDIAFSLFKNSLQNQKKLFFKVCVFGNSLDGSALELSQIFQEAFCGKQKIMTRKKLNFRINEKTEKEVFYCGRVLTPLNEIILEKNPTKKMMNLRNCIKGSDVLIFVVTENFYEDAGYYKMFRNYLARFKLENIRSIFIKADPQKNNSQFNIEKKEIIQKFGLKEKIRNDKTIKIMNCDMNSSNKAILNRISVYLKKNFQKKIKAEHFTTIKFVEIFTNIYHILKSEHKEENITDYLMNGDYRSYFYNKNLFNTCLAKFYNSFSKSLNEFAEIPEELITSEEKKKLMKIKKQKDILVFLMQKCFLDSLDKKYRKMIKLKLSKFFDYSILEEILIKYFRGFVLFEDEEIFDALNKYMVPLYEYFNYQEGYGIEGYWNEFFLAVLRCLHFLFKNHKFYIRIETTFDFEIDAQDFVSSTNKEIEDHKQWIKKINNYSAIPHVTHSKEKRKPENDLVELFPGFQKDKKLCLEKKEKINEKDRIFIL